MPPLVKPTDLDRAGVPSAAFSRRGQWLALASVLPLAIAIGGCGDLATQPVAAGTGLRPNLVAPQSGLIPTVNIAPAIGWPSGGMPIPAAGLQVNAFASGLDHPRWLASLPNGDLLVAESNAPPKSTDGLSLKDRLLGWVTGRVMERAGATVPSANRITLLRDSDGDGVADFRSSLLEGLNSPFGMVLLGHDLYIANTDAIVKFQYMPGDTRITGPGIKVLELPAGAINHHWTKNLIASPDGKRLFVSVGSNSNVGERGMAAEVGRAAIWEYVIATGESRVFASGLRNPNGMAWEPHSGALWTVVNERDELGSDLVPDYLTSVRDGAFYGWPYSYFGQQVDARAPASPTGQRPQATVPDYALGPHTASLGLTWSAGTSLPAPYADGMFIGQHGSWNRKPHSGYKVIFVPFAAGQPVDGQPIDVLSGFLSDDGRAFGRPVGVALDTRGALLVADDVGNVIWRVSKKP
jgi:glucose/arabinose dehydrogenase